MSKSINQEKELVELLKTMKRSVVLFYAPWCPFCRNFLPLFEKHAETAGDNFCRVNIDDIKTCEEKYKIDVVPTVLCFEKGKVVERLDGEQGIGLNEMQLKRLIAPCKRDAGR